MRRICLGLAAAIVVSSACGRPPQSRVTAIEARIDGITCPTCVPPLEASLRRQYAASTVEVDESKETATVRFTPKDRFTPADFRAAVERVRMRVVTFRMEACGTVEAADGGMWLAVGSDRFLVRSDRDLPLNKPICAEGTLDTRGNPATFQVRSFK